MNADCCEFCGCTELRACMDPFDGEPHPCQWIMPGVCSACRYMPLGIRAPLPHELLDPITAFLQKAA